MGLYNIFFNDDEYNKDKISAIFIISRLEAKIKHLEKIDSLENLEDDIVCNINNKKLIIKVLKYIFNL